MTAELCAVLLLLKTLLTPALRQLILLASVASALYLTGVIWTVQIAHYPLMDRVGPAAWKNYHAGHTYLLSWVVMVPMIVELGAAGLLVLAPPPGIPRAFALAGFALAALTWAATFFVSVPLHNRLAAGWDPAAHRALVATNWLRTALWSGHGLIAVEMVRRLLPSR